MVKIQRQGRAFSSLGSRDGLMLCIGAVVGGFIIGSIMCSQGMIPSKCPHETKKAAVSASTEESEASRESRSGDSTGKEAKFLPEGMNPIYSYYGKMDHMFHDIPTDRWLQPSSKHQTRDALWFSQHGQDVAVAQFLNFERNGFFVDLAANEAVWASNTFALEQNFGWSGICIEPNPQYWYRLSFRNCHVVGAIVGGRTSNVEVDVQLGEAHHGPVGGIVGDQFDNKKLYKKSDDVDQTSYKRFTVALATVLEMFQAPHIIDYLSLDVEGAETYILRDFPFDKYQFRAMTIERPDEELRKILAENGYLHVFDLKRGDTLWAHKSEYDESKQFNDAQKKNIDSHRVQGGVPE